MDTEKQQVEAKIFEWREKIKNEYLYEMARHWPSDISEEGILSAINMELKEFDQHFGITTQRNGTTK